jgi:signal transduction histidine kinase
VYQEPLGAGVADEFEKVLSVLVHDVRTPLGVALGYVRLIKDERLPSAEERERALARTLDALSRMWQLCQDADGFLAAGSPTTAVRVPVFVARLEGQLGSGRLIRPQGDTVRTSSLRTAGRADELIRAIDTVVSLLAGFRDDEHVVMAIEADPGELRLCAAPRANVGSVAATAGPSCDPWTGGHGLALPLACRRIALVGGSVTIPTDGAVTIAFPLESHPS